MLNALIKSTREQTDADSESLEASLENLRSLEGRNLFLNQQHQFQSRVHSLVRLTAPSVTEMLWATRYCVQRPLISCLKYEIC